MLPAFDGARHLSFGCRKNLVAALEADHERFLPYRTWQAEYYHLLFSTVSTYLASDKNLSFAFVKR